MTGLFFSLIQMEDFNREQYSYLEKLADEYSKFFNRLQTVGITGRQVQETGIITDGMAIMRSAPKADTTIENYIELRKRYKAARDIYRIFEDSLNNLEVGSTVSGVVITSKFLDALLEIWAVISLLYSEWDQKASAAEYIYEKHMREKDPLDSVDKLRLLRAEYKPEATPLYKIILIRALDSKNKDLRREIRNWVEDLKTSTLAVPQLDTWQSYNRINAVQSLIQIKWAPKGKARPLNEVLDEIMPTNKSSRSRSPGKSGSKEAKRMLQDAAKLLSKDRRVGFICINKITPKPLGYDMSMLSEPIDPRMGVNKKLVEKLQTIKALKPEGKDGIDVIEGDIYYILETLDGRNYRQLVGRKDYFKISVDPARIPSRRLGGYNCIVGAEAMAAKTDPLILESQLERAEIDRDETYWKGIRIEILRMVDEIPVGSLRSLDKLKAELANLGSRVAEHIHFEIFKAKIIDFPENVRNYINRELRCSYVNELSNLQRGFSRDLDLLWNREKTNIEAIPADEKNRLREAIRTLLDRVLEHHVNRRSNIYINIDNKFTVLMKAFAPK